MNRLSPLHLLSVLVTLLLVAPSRAEAQAQAGAATPTETRLVILDDIAYRPGPSAAWRLDLAMPENIGQDPRPAIVIVHGGGWTGGSRRGQPYRSMLVEFALKGYVTLSIDYRLHGETAFPASMEDVDCAVRWLRSNAERYNVDPDRIGAYGHSAGAHLALMLAASPPAPPIQSDCEWNAYSSAVTAVAAGAPPTILPARFADSERYSPASYIAGSVPPLLLIQGTADPIVRVETVDDYVQKLQAAGAPDVTYVRIDGGDHSTAYDMFMVRSTQAISDFFARTLRHRG